MLQAAIIMNVPCTTPATTMMAAEALKLLHLDTAELLQLGILTAQVCWWLFGAVSANLHTVHISLALQAALVA